MKRRMCNVTLCVIAVVFGVGCTSTFGQGRITTEYLEALADAESIAKAGGYNGPAGMTTMVGEDGRSGRVKVRGRGAGTFSCTIRIVEGNQMAAPHKEVDDFFSMGVRKIGSDTIAYYRSDIEARLAFYAKGRTVTVDLMREDKTYLTFIEDIARLIYGGL